ncbi:GNAT family N-acetyltransferase [Streptosporangium sp. NPDC051023]|uniref:GNAT family N-acetyltransferase n=1 Tax=Streptosporangium sp. NPDC051023 TaxID=3155410 RepID=UPI00344B83DE
MFVEEIVSHLELTSPEELRAARVPRRHVTLWEVGTEHLQAIREVHDRVAWPHGWPSLLWSSDTWWEHLERPGVRTWIAEVDGQVAGLAQLQAQPGGAVEIEFFGLAPEFVGVGIGGHLLTLVTRLAWEFAPVDGTPIGRVWLRTSSHDHGNAVANYRARGFRLHHIEVRQREFVLASR